jgi:hypothetical protein
VREVTQAAAAGATVTTDLPPLPDGGGKVLEVFYVPSAAITVNATNFRRLRVLNVTKGNAVVASKDFSAGSAAAPTAVPLTLAAGDPPFVSEGDVLRVSSEPVGTGQADPGGQAYVIVQQPGAAAGQV